MTKQNVEEAILLAETIAAVEESKNPTKADEVSSVLITQCLHRPYSIYLVSSSKLRSFILVRDSSQRRRHFCWKETLTHVRYDLSVAFQKPLVTPFVMQSVF